MMAADIVIVGAGPAGSAAALTLGQRAPELRIVLLDGDTSPGFRPGEVLPAAGAAMLHQLGVAAIASAAATPAPGYALLWGSDQPQERDALFSTQGSDWHLDRHRFDRLLATAAVERGIIFHPNSRLQHATRQAGGGWHLTIDQQAPLQARFVIWATGRRRDFLGLVGARQHSTDRLAAHLVFYRESRPGDRRFLLEATPEGWWYAAATPGGGRTIGFLSDADLLRRSLRANPDWPARVAQTRLIAAGLAPDADIIARHTCGAASSLVTPVIGTDWAAAGDAACCFEPLSSQGIAKALRSGCFAAYAALDCLRGQAEIATARYEHLIQGEFRRYQTALYRHYASETRWPDAPFWQRRHRLFTAEDSTAPPP